MKRGKQRKIRKTPIVLSIIFAILFAGITFLADWGSIKESPKIAYYDSELPYFLYEDTVDETEYSFNGYNESYIICKVQNTAYTNFTFNNTIYDASYGLNYYMVDFADVEESYDLIIEQADVNNDVFDWFCVQPLLIDEDEITVNMSTSEDITFNSGGGITLLFQPNFTYNELWIEFDGIVIKDDFTGSQYPDVSSIELISFMYSGDYIQYDIPTIPGEHTLKFKGNGTIDYKIITDGDWDMDLIPDSEEIQKMEQSYKYNPTEPVVWGYFERGDFRQFVYDSNLNESVSFAFFIPITYTGQGYLSIILQSGSIYDIILDGNITLHEGDTISTSYESISISIPCKKMSSGYHSIEFSVKLGCLLDVFFIIDGVPVLGREMGGTRDSDMDGMSDDIELTNNLDPMDADTDLDSVIDGFDASPANNLTLDKDNIHNFVITNNQSLDTLITLVIERPENDYYTNETMIWTDSAGDKLKVRIIPMLRALGNSSITDTVTETTWDKSIILYDLSDGNYTSYGDCLRYNDTTDEEYDLAFIQPDISEETFTYNFLFDRDHPAKDDDVIELNFDIVWVVIEQGVDLNVSKIIHYYDFVDDINLVSFTKREFGNVSYILASPDSHIENEIFYMLIHNPELGSFEDFSVDGDVDGSGNVEYSKLIEALEDDRDTNPISVDANGVNTENEVIYLSHYVSTNDILSNLCAIELGENATEDLKNFGNYNTFSSMYSSNDVVNDDLDSYMFEDNVGKVSESITETWSQCTFGSEEPFELRASIVSFPIYMNRITDYDGAEVLEVVFAFGSKIPLNEIPDSLDEELYDWIILINNTIIEKDDDSSGIPSIGFDSYNDIFKVDQESRIFEVEMGQLIFCNYSDSFALIWSYLRETGFFDNPKVIMSQLLLGMIHEICKDFASMDRHDNMDWFYTRTFNWDIDLTTPGSKWVMEFVKELSDMYPDIITPDIEGFRTFSKWFGMISLDFPIFDFDQMFVLPEGFTPWATPYKPYQSAIHAIDMQFGVGDRRYVDYDGDEWWVLTTPRVVPDLVGGDQLDQLGAAFQVLNNPWNPNDLPTVTLFEVMEIAGGGMEDVSIPQQIHAMRYLIETGEACWERLNTFKINMLIQDVESWEGSMRLMRQFDQAFPGLPPIMFPETLTDCTLAMKYIRDYIDFLKARVEVFEGIMEGYANGWAIYHSDLAEWEREAFALQKRVLNFMEKIRMETYEFKVTNLMRKGGFIRFDGIIDIVGGLLEFLTAFSMSKKSNLSIFRLRMVTGLMKTAFGIFQVISGSLIKSMGRTIYTKGYSAIETQLVKNLWKYSRWLGKAVVVAGASLFVLDIILTIYTIAEHGHWLISNKGVAIVYELAKVAVVMFISIKVMAAISITGFTGCWVGTAVGLAITTVWFLIEFAVFFITNLLKGHKSPPIPGNLINNDTDETYFEINEAELKRQGSFEIGDEVKFNLNITNDGGAEGWVRSNFSSGGSSFSSYQGEFGEEGYEYEDTASYTHTRTLPGTKTHLENKVGFEIDMDLDGRKNIHDDISAWNIFIPVLDSDIADFYDDLVEFDEPDSYNELELLYKLVEDTYQHKDKKDALTRLRRRIKYDFLDDNTGEMPSGWYNESTGLGVFTEISMPIADDFHPYYYWSDSTGDDYYTEIDEDEEHWGYEYPVTSIAWNSGDYYFDDGYHGYTVKFNFSDIDCFSACFKVDVRLLAKGVADENENTRARISFDGGASWSSQLNNRINGWWDWYTYSFTGLEEDDFSDFQVELQCPDIPTFGHYAEVDVLYLNVTYVRTGDVSNEIISSSEGHNNVLDVKNYGKHSSTIINNFFSIWTTGNLEFWLYKDSNLTTITVDEFFKIDKLGNVFELDGETSLEPGGIELYGWEYCKVSFNSTSFDLYINNVKVANDISHSRTGTLKIEFVIANDIIDNDEYSITHTYLDAIDYSFDLYYYEGRGFEYDYTLDKIQEYGWKYGNMSIYTNIETDLSENIVEMDTTTDKALFDFSLVLEGTHNPYVNYTFDLPTGFTITPTTITDVLLDSSVQFNISATDAYQYAGVYYFEMNITLSDSDVVIYSEQVPFIIPVDDNLVIEQNGIIFNETDFNGNYTSTYDFLGDTGIPDGWTSVGHGAYVYDYDVIDEHTDPVYLADSGGLRAGMYRQVDQYDDGSVEFWVRKSSEDYYGNHDTGLNVRLYTASENGVEISIDRDNNGKILCREGANYVEYYSGFEHDTWYHMRIDFGLDPEDYDLYLNGALLGVGIDWYYHAGDYIKHVMFETDESNRHGTWYVDAIGWSWDSDYKCGDNMYITHSSTEEYQSSTELEKGDVIFFEYKTNTYSEIVMDFLNNNIIQATYTMIPRGNLYLGVQYSHIIIDEDFSFDKIEFSDYKSNYLEIFHISVIDASAEVTQQFNPINFTNNGNIPKFVSFEFSGVYFNNVSKTLYPDEFFGESQIAVILPNSNRISNFDITLPDESISNLLWRGITYTESGTNNNYNLYTDNLEIDGIYIVSHENRTYNIIGETISSGKYEMNLEIIPEESLVWKAYSLDGNANVSFSGNNVNVSLPETYGNHSIQVFGNNSLGTMFESEIRYFTIEYPIKILTITNRATYYDTNNEMLVNATFGECSDFEYSLDGRSRKSLNTTTNLIEHIPYGLRNILVYGNDTYGEEYSSGLIEFYIALDRQSPSQPEGFTFTNGSLLEPYGDLQFIDGNYSIISHDDVNQFIDSITYTFGSAGEGTIANTYTDDSNYKELDIGYSDFKFWVDVTLNFDPSLAGRDFYMSAHFGCSKVPGHLYINGEIEKSGNTIDFDNELYEDVTSIRYKTDWSCDNYWSAYIYYFELVEPIGEIDVQIDMNVNDTDLHEIEYLQYSHRTNVSATVDLDIWNWTDSQWYEIESVDNSVSFDNHQVALGNNSDYLNLTDNNVRIRFQSTGLTQVQLEIDSLKLLYSTNVVPCNLNKTPIQPDNFTISRGTFNIYGELGTIDGNYSTIKSDSSSGSYFTIIPNGDSTPLEWLSPPSGAHWSKIDEDPDANDGASTVVYRYHYSDKIEVIDYTSGDLNGGTVYKIVVRYAYRGLGGSGDASIDINLGGWQGYKVVTRPAVDYDAQELEWTGLTGDQTDVDNFQIRLKSLIAPYSYNIFTAIWVKVYYTEPRIDVQIDLQIDDEYCYFPNSISYSYKTNISETIDFDIWNWQTNTWYEIESVNNSATFDDDIFWLDYGCAYVNSTNGIRIRFQSIEDEPNFQLEIDQLRLEYYNIR
ncbi:MAG: hypothetical protein ACFFFT_01920 [Candidatus Thorarchaeota archaeon]